MKITKKNLQDLIEDVLMEMEMAEHDDPDCDKWADYGFKSREACCEDNPADCKDNKDSDKDSNKANKQAKIKKENKNMKITKNILEEMIIKQLHLIEQEQPGGDEQQTVSASLVAQVDTAITAINAVVSAMDALADTDNVGQAEQVRALAAEIMEDLEELKEDLV